MERGIPSRRSEAKELLLLDHLFIHSLTINLSVVLCCGPAAYARFASRHHNSKRVCNPIGNIPKGSVHDSVLTPDFLKNMFNEASASISAVVKTCHHSCFKVLKDELVVAFFTPFDIVQSLCLGSFRHWFQYGRSDCSARRTHSFFDWGESCLVGSSWFLEL
jgi:hypothetical protein